MTPLPYLNVFRISGTDAAGFLHAQVAADTLALPDGQAGFAAYCSPRGQVIALLLVCRRGGDWLVITETGLANTVADRLRRYILRSKVSIDELPGTQVAGLNVGETAETGVMSFEAGRSRLRYALTGSGHADPGAVLHWRVEEIRHGISWLQGSTSEKFLPQMLGLDTIGAISFSKGCYPGQEIIARTRYLGKLKRWPVLLLLQANPPLNPGDACRLTSADNRVEAVVVDAVCEDGKSTIVRVVAPLGADGAVDAVEVNGLRWPAERI